jgi:CheY-like chemotaxis protein
MNAPTNDDARAPILLVDDIPENLFAMAELLSLPSYDLVQVGSGAAALEQVRQREFAVVLLDVQMPGMDGFQTAAEMKRIAADQRHEVPVIFVTAIETDRSHISRAYLRAPSTSFRSRSTRTRFAPRCRSSSSSTEQRSAFDAASRPPSERARIK